MDIRSKKHRTGVKLSTTLTIAFAVLSGFALFISGGLGAITNAYQQQQNILKEQQLAAQGAASTVSSFIQEKISELRTAARITSSFTGSPEANQETLDSLLGFETAFRQVVRLDAQGQITARSSRISQGGSEQLNEELTPNLLEQIQQVDRYISPVYFDAFTSEPLALLIVPTTNIMGDFQGALVAELNLKFMWDLVDQIEIGQTGYAYVVDENGTLIAFGDRGKVLRGETLLNLPEVAQFVNNPNVNDQDIEEFIGINGTNVFGTYVPLDQPTWAVMTEIPQQEAIQPIINAIISSTAINIGVVLLAILVGSFLARRLTAQINQLTEAALKIAGGDLNVRAPVTMRNEIGTLATTFNQMAEQLSSLVTGLEQRVSDRTKALVTSSEVSRRLSTILEQDKLVTEVVNQLQRAFDYYHVHIYLFDADQANLVLAGGTGEAGQVLLSRGHKLPRGRGLVGRAAETGVPVFVPDVTRAEGWLPNPLLPDTKSELAVPIILGEQVLGVLDVQQNRAEGLKQEDIDLLQSIANQVAIGLQNARAYADTRRRADREAVITAISQRIQHTTTAEDALKVAVREIGHVLGTRSTVQLGTSLAPHSEPGNGVAGNQKTSQDN